jgi:hypothetical protein
MRDGPARRTIRSRLPISSKFASKPTATSLMRVRSQLVGRFASNLIPQGRASACASIAHEIAHTLFDDVAEPPRHRGGSGSASDEWQLEMLCNLAAAEFVMPLGSLPPSERLPKIEQLMLDRRKFDVSAEAYLIRVVKTTAEPALMFCARPISCEGLATQYRVDYSIGSRSAPPVLAAGASIPDHSVVYQCTAIGQTNHAPESWVVDKPLTVECVGIPGFPGATLPRIAGIVHFRLKDAEQEAFRWCMAMFSSRPGPGRKSYVSW